MWFSLPSTVSTSPVITMSDGPKEHEVREAYEPVFRFLKSIDEIAAAVESCEDSELLRQRADVIESEVERLKAPFDQLQELRAMASQSAEARRVDRSDTWVVEVVMILGSRIASWVRDVGGYLLSKELAEAGIRKPSLLDCFRAENPLDPEEVAECRDLLMNEQALLVTYLHKGIPEAPDGQREPAGKQSLQQKQKPKNAKEKAGEISKRPRNEIVLAALREWHQFDTENFRDGPVGVRDLTDFISELDANVQGCSKSSVGRAFNDLFGGHRNYEAMCAKKTIAQELKALSGEFTPRELRQQLKDEFATDAKAEWQRDDD